MQPIKQIENVHFCLGWLIQFYFQFRPKNLNAIELQNTEKAKSIEFSYRLIDIDMFVQCAGAQVKIRFSSEYEYL